MGKDILKPDDFLGCGLKAASTSNKEGLLMSPNKISYI